MNDPSVPLCIDLDETLTPINTLHEQLLNLIRQSPSLLLVLPFWYARGKDFLAREVASRAQIDPTSLPYRPDVLALVNQAKFEGRSIVLSASTDSGTADAVANHLGIFDEVHIWGNAKSVSGEVARLTLAERFGNKGFDYISSRSRSEIWQSARRVVVIGSARTAERVGRVTDVTARLPPARIWTGAWLRAMRIHQWVKNALIFLPAVLAHQILRVSILEAALLAFFAFNLCASSVYIVNDLFDLTADRRHPRKRTRAFAAGALSVRSGIAAALLLLSIAAVITSGLAWRFGAVLAAYYGLTWAYSLRLKREPLIDVMTLAGLYTIRIIAGAAATQIHLSFWLLAFSVFLFLSLGIVKRFTELTDRRNMRNRSLHGRDYSTSDLPLLMGLGVSSGFSAVVVIALYINSAESVALYHHGKFLWLICPLMLYWISRIWLLTSRGEMHDDPVVFALSDRISLLILGSLAATVLLSI